MKDKPKIQNAIIIGGTSGIGRELARQLCGRGVRVAVTGRRRELLDELAREFGKNCIPRYMDVSQFKDARGCLADIIMELGDVDLIVISAGIGFVDPEHTWDKEKNTIDVNVTGFAAIANASYKYFSQRGQGSLVGISSIAAIRGGDAPPYFASKAFVRNYLQGLRRITAKSKSNVIITEVMPGFVDTAMAKGPGLFWVAPVEKAARQILAAIDKGKTFVYITKRWRLVAWVLKLMPDWLYNKI
jgi:short-subunit dehydrogenase